MTVRGVFYALTTTGHVPKTEQGYRAVQRQVLAMRREGVLDWDFIADATRWMRKAATHGSSESALAALARSYRRNLWQAQSARVEVWLEKDALAGVLVEETDAWDVALMVSRGTSSETFLYSAARAADGAWRDGGIETHVFALYDFDAGGARAAGAVRDGLGRLAPGVPIHFRRLAVTPEQVRDWSLPTRPAKRSDPEAAKFGAEAVELDAIPPDRLRGLVRDAVVALIDPGAWRFEQAVEAEERRGLEALAFANGGDA